MKFAFSPLGALRTLGKSLLMGIIPLATLLLVSGGEWLFMEYGIILVFVLELPLMILFFQYYFNDRNTTLEISVEEQLLVLNRVSNHMTVPFSQIKHIEHILPPGMVGEDPHRLYPQDDYFYLRFYLTTGVVFSVTSLLLKGQDIKFEGVTTQVKIKFLPFL